MEKIDKNSHKKIFKWLLADKSHACHNETNSEMIRVLVEEHNQMVDEINHLKKLLWVKKIATEAELH